MPKYYQDVKSITTLDSHFRRMDDLTARDILVIKRFIYGINKDFTLCFSKCTYYNIPHDKLNE